MPKYKHKCPKHNEIDLYSGCSFNCIYCVAKENHEQNIKPVIQFDEFNEKVENGFYEDYPFYFSPWTDAYQDSESILNLAGRCIEILRRKDMYFFIITKSPLILKDLDYFRNNHKSFIAISLNSLDNSISDLIEPEAPSSNERQELIELLVSQKDIKTVVKVDPIIPGLTDNQLNKITKWLTKIRPYAITFETSRLNKKIVKNMSKYIDAETMQNVLSYYPRLNDKPEHPFLHYRLKLFEDMAEHFEKENIKTSFCKASLPIEFSHYDCRGGY